MPSTIDNSMKHYTVYFTVIVKGKRKRALWKGYADDARALLEAFYTQYHAEDIHIIETD